MTRPQPDLRAYFVTGADDPFRLAQRARAAALGGAGIIQLRSKPITPRQLFDLGLVVSRALDGTRAALVIDDAVDVALALRQRGARVDGVHVGQDDLPVEHVRALLGPDAIVGLTTGTRDLVERANNVAEYIDYIGCGPFRPTPTKNSGRTPIGLDGYAELVALSRVPVVAIGDIHLDDVQALASTGVAGVAIVRGFMNSEDPTQYARTIITNFEKAGQS
ncbi:thiamine phosphate synthase [Schaalia sp. ZJ405]|uniref:thiamine phosphate synthase n=1 Tax=Schaalia sp. ZJ405 TaxID=2709403 RepID=UPI0013E9DC1C|nr:thiamine phosphate synthase [Schaalia sp. ZJ405]QPK81416.1 thiamine phosphate synthase [Schaalia sp. ZJ405]